MRTNLPDNDGKPAGGAQLLAVGRWLQAAREQKGESLDAVSRVTRIGKSYLEAIEEGAAARLPSQAYYRGFIRLYAAHLGLSPDDAVRMLTSQPTETPSSELSETLTAPPQYRPAALPSSGRNSARKFLVPLVVVLALAGIALAMLYWSGNRPAADTPERIQPPAAATTTRPVTGQPAPESAPTPTPTPALPGTAETIPGDGLVLRLKAVSAGRLHITIDGSISQEYDLVAGDLVEWKAEKLFLLDLENAAAVEADLNGKPLQPLGETGKAAHLIIRHDGVHQN